MDKSITQDIAYHQQSLMKYAKKYGVSLTSQSRSYIHFWKARWNRTVLSFVYLITIPASTQKHI